MTPFQPVKVDECNSCGSTIKQFNPDSDIIICEHCGADSSAAKTEEQKSTNSYSAPKNPLLKLHETFEYESVTWQIIGCISYQGTVKEWDSEDNKWETNPWKYNSWWVINEARQVAWIVHDSTGYKWSSKTTMASRIPKNDRSYEQGSWNIVSAVGEFSYFPTIGGQSVSYERGDTSIEILLDSEGNNKEVESFNNERIKPLALFEAFNKTNLLADLKRSKLAFKLIIASLLCLVGGFFALAGTSEPVLEIPVKTIQQPFGSEPIALGELSLDKKSLLKFKFWSNLPRRDGAFDADLIIQDDQQKVVSTLPISLWRASGRDSDGAWTESNRSTSPLLRLPANKQYKLYLKPTSFNKWDKLGVSGLVSKNIASTLPLYIGLALFVLLLLFQFSSRKNFIRKHTGLKV